MRLHTDTLSAMHIIHAFQAEKQAGRIAHHASIEISKHGSRSHARAFEVKLAAHERDRGRRAGNSGSYGAMRPEVDGFAATYDEWGWLLGALYRLDRNLVVGTVKRPIYADRGDFYEKTALAYEPRALVRAMQEIGGDPFPHVQGAGARTKRGYLVGRFGAGRGGDRYPWTVERPRTIEQVLEHAHAASVDDLPEYLGVDLETAATR